MKLVHFLADLIEGAEVGFSWRPLLGVVTKLSSFLLVHLLHTQRGLPIDAVTDRLSAAQKHWEGPNPWIRPENLSPVIPLSNVILAHVRLALLIQVFNCCLVFKGQFDVELEKSSHQNADDGVKHKCDHDEGISAQLNVILVNELLVEAPFKSLVKVVSHREEG